MLAGVCGGLGRYFDVNPLFYRVGFVVLTLLGGAGALIYGASLLVIPVEGEQDSICPGLPAGSITRAQVGTGHHFGGEYGTLAERILNPKGMQIINEATWDTAGIKCVIGHSDDEQTIAALTTGEKTVRMPALGPYRGNREPSLFDWARPGLHLALH